MHFEISHPRMNKLLGLWLTGAIVRARSAEIF